MTEDHREIFPVYKDVVVSREPRRPVSDVSVIICTHDDDRWEQLLAALDSIGRQSVAPKQVVVVVDHNLLLFERAVAALPPTTVVVHNLETRGVSGARNCGVAAAAGSVVAFLDDDATAEQSWLETLASEHRDELILGVGGPVLPVWLSHRPRWLPEEFYWVVGCSYRGLPTERRPIRNVFGGNMSVRRSIFNELGGFRVHRLADCEAMSKKTVDYGAEETEFCIRASAAFPQMVWIYEPSMRIHHCVPSSRVRFRYFLDRCRIEGRVKARVVVRSVGFANGLATERHYVSSTLVHAVGRDVAGAFMRRDLAGLLKVGAVASGVCAAALGYTEESLKALFAGRA